MVKICPKLDQNKLRDPELVKKLLDEGFSSFELHTTQNSNWAELSDVILNSGLQVEAVHTPNKLKNGKWSTLCTEDDIAKQSTDSLYEVIQFSKRVGSKKVVFHTWIVSYFDEKKIIGNVEEKRNKGRKNLVNNLLQINNPEVTLLPEVSPIMFWTSNILYLCPVACTSEDFKEIINGVSEKTDSPNIAVALDVDHAYRSAICNGRIYESFISALKVDKPLEEILENFVCDPMLNHYSKNPQYTNHLVENELDRLFKLSIPHIHTCGIAHPQDKRFKSSILIPLGEHIPVGYKGVSSAGERDGHVEDVMDHKLYLKHVKGTDTAIILEFSPRKDYDFFKQIIDSRKYLERELSEL